MGAGESLKKKWHKHNFKCLLIVLLLVQFGILISMSGRAINRIDVCSREVKAYIEDSLKKPASAQYLEFQKKAETAKIDSLYHQLLLETHSAYNARLDNTLADLRQELSNQMSSLNTFVAIWICVLSFAGVVLPLLISYLARFESEKKLEDKLAELNVEIEQKSKDWEQKEVVNQINNVMNCITTLKELGVKYYPTDFQSYLSKLLALLNRKNEFYLQSIRKSGILVNDEFLVYLLQFRVLLVSLETFYTYSSSLKVMASLQCVVDELKEVSASFPGESTRLSDTMNEKLNVFQEELRNLLIVTNRELHGGRV